MTMRTMRRFCGNGHNISIPVDSCHLCRVTLHHEPEPNAQNATLLSTRCKHKWPVPRAARHEPCSECDPNRYRDWKLSRIPHPLGDECDYAFLWCDWCGRLWPHAMRPDRMYPLRSWGRDAMVGFQAEQEEDVLITYTRHSTRKVRTSCKGCGTTELYWAHETPKDVIVTGDEPDYCDRCATFGALVLVDAETLRPHECVPSHSTGGESGGDDTGDYAQAQSEPAEPEDSELPHDRSENSHQAENDPWNDLTPEDSGNPEADGDGEGEPEPPWKTDAAEREQQQSASENDDFSDPEDQDDKPDHEHDQYVLESKWFEARCSDGDWLKDNTERVATDVERASRHYTDQHVRLARAMAVKDSAEYLETRLKDFTPSAGAAGELVIKVGSKPAKKLDGLHHKQLPTVIKMAGARLHCLMVGGAGVGKGKMVRQAADALSLPFYALPASLNPQTPVSHITGYMQASGDYIRTLFRDAFEKGGVMFLDEIDNAHPSALAAINDALAVDPGETVAFPDGMVKRHADFVCVAAANTYGRGPDQTYAARQRGDAATWDRFNLIHVEIDEPLEMTLASRTGAPVRVVAEVVRYIRALRHNAWEKRKPVVLGPRAVIDMCKMISADISTDEAVFARLRRGMSDQDWKDISGGVRDLELSDLVMAS
jgi:cobaltochelatase CobS